MSCISNTRCRLIHLLNFARVSRRRTIVAEAMIFGCIFLGCECMGRFFASQGVEFASLWKIATTVHKTELVCNSR
ncbi:hypothetical protein BDV11DRAFT_50243 [Aspergillus similis]